MSSALRKGQGFKQTHASDHREPQPPKADPGAQQKIKTTEAEVCL